MARSKEQMSRSKAGRKASNKASSDVIVGRRAVAEALDAGVPIDKLLVSLSSIPDEISALMSKASHVGAEVHRVQRSELDSIAATIPHQGIVAVARPFEYSSLGQIMQSCEGKKAALVVLLDHISDVGNFGAIIRSCEVIGASGVVIPDRRSASVVPTVYKTSAGAVSRMPIARVPNVSTACNRLKDNGFWIAGASEKAADDCWAAPMSGRLGLVMGSEENGISRLVLSHCDFLVRLPQIGEIASLNVSCAMSALGYEWMRRSYIEGLLDIVKP